MRAEYADASRSITNVRRTSGAEFFDNRRAAENEKLLLSPL